MSAPADVENPEAIEIVADLYRRDFRDLMTRYQETSDAAQAIRLRDQLVHEVFGG